MSVSLESVSSVSLRHEPSSRPLLTVVIPVYNGGDEIVQNVGIIRRAIADGLAGEEFELVVVSDGSIDGTAERLLVAHADAGIRVIHYDRNLGKGYAVKAGALVAHGDWVAVVDADLDLDQRSSSGSTRRRAGIRGRSSGSSSGSSLWRYGAHACSSRRSCSPAPRYWSSSGRRLPSTRWQYSVPVAPAFILLAAARRPRPELRSRTTNVT